MNPKLTPEMMSALNQQVGPIPLESENSDEPVFLVRLQDIPDLQKLVDKKIKEKLAQADEDIEAGRVANWDVEDIKKRGRARFEKRNNQ